MAGIGVYDDQTASGDWGMGWLRPMPAATSSAARQAARRIFFIPV
jgi:hypothetical protein